MSKMILETKDKKIILELLENSRLPISILSKKTGLTREIINYRINKLEKEGIIKDYITIVNQSLFCSGIATLMCKLVNINEEKLGKIINFIKKHEAVNWCSELCGSYDLVLTFLYKDSQDLDTIISEITNFIGKNLKEHSLSLYISEYKFDRKSLVLEKPILEYDKNTVNFGKYKVDLDALDSLILELLLKNARIKNIDIAKKLKANEDLIRLRIKKLIEKNIIRGFTLVLDTNKLGYEAYYMGLQVEQMNQETINKIRSYIQKNPYIMYCARTSGKYNIVMTINTKNREHFKKLLNEIRNEFSSELRGYEFQISLQDHKEIFVPEKYLKLKI